MKRIGHASRLNSATNPIELPQRDRAGGDPPRADRDQERRREGREGVERRLERRPHVPGLDAFVPAARADARAGRSRPLAAERLHDQRAVDRLVRHGRDLADPLLRPTGGSSIRLAKLRFISASVGNRIRPRAR